MFIVKIGGYHEGFGILEFSARILEIALRKLLAFSGSE